MTIGLLEKSQPKTKKRRNPWNLTTQTWACFFLLMATSEMIFLGGFQFNDPFTLPETNSKFAPENRPSKKETILFQPSIFRCYVMLVSGRVRARNPPWKVLPFDPKGKSSDHLPTSDPSIFQGLAALAVKNFGRVAFTPWFPYNRGWENQPNSRGLYTHYKDSLLKVGWPSPIQPV